MSLPPVWTPLDETKRKTLNVLVNTFDERYQEQLSLISIEPTEEIIATTTTTTPKEIKPEPGAPAPASASASAASASASASAAEAEAEAAEAEAKQSVDIELLRILKAGGATDDDLLLIGATMIANK